MTSSPGGITASGPTSPITVPGLTNGTSYTFTVTATNGVGTGAPRRRRTRSHRPRAPPAGAPTGVTATAGNGQATVSFTAARLRRRLGDHRLHRHLVARGHHRQRHGEPDHRHRASPTAQLHLHRHRHERRRHEPALQPVQRGHAHVAVAPGAPTGVTATRRQRQRRVSFTPPASDGGAAITSYTVTSSPATTPPAAPAARSPSPASPTASLHLHRHRDQQRRHRPRLDRVERRHAEAGRALDTTEPALRGIQAGDTPFSLPPARGRGSRGAEAPAAQAPSARLQLRHDSLRDQAIAGVIRVEAVARANVRPVPESRDVHVRMPGQAARI